MIRFGRTNWFVLKHLKVWVRNFSKSIAKTDQTFILVRNKGLIRFGIISNLIVKLSKSSVIKATF